MKREEIIRVATQAQNALSAVNLLTSIESTLSRLENSQKRPVSLDVRIGVGGVCAFSTTHIPDICHTSAQRAMLGVTLEEELLRDITKTLENFRTKLAASIDAFNV